MSEFEKYNAEVQQKWGETDAYKEHTKKTKDYSSDKWNNLADEMNEIFARFADCMKSGENPGCAQVQELVKALQNHITDNYYSCEVHILAGLGRMYVADERFRNNIDKHAEGTAEFISRAIEIYCS